MQKIPKNVKNARENAKIDRKFEGWLGDYEARERHFWFAHVQKFPWRFREVWQESFEDRYTFATGPRRMVLYG